MKRLDLPAATDQLDLYNLLYVGLNNPNAQLTPPELRTHAKILDKLEALGVQQDDGTAYTLPAGTGVTLVLEDAEYALAKKLCESFPWNVAASRRVVQLFDLLEQAPAYLVPAPDPAQA